MIVVFIFSPRHSKIFRHRTGTGDDGAESEDSVRGKRVENYPLVPSRSTISAVSLFPMR